MKDAVVYGSLLVLLALQVGLFFYASFRALWKYRHRKTYELVIAAILTFGFLDSMARKPGQGVHNNGSSSFTQYTIQNNGVGVEGAYASQPTSLITTNDFYFSGISVFTNRVELGLSWREGFFSGGEVIDLFAWWPTITNEVKWVGTTAVHPGSTNSLFEISASALGCTNMPSALFLRASERASAASTMNDWDGDGIPDLYEVHNGTNPYIPDASLISRITVGTNGLYQDIASAISASTNFSIVSLNDEVYELSDSLVMPAYPIILEGPQNGYAVVRSKAKVGAVMLTQEQSEKTLFRNLILSLEAQFGFQAGFWVGGNLPWAGVGSAARFENVRIRAPYPDVEYFGWVFYRDETGASLITNCTMNAAGATWAYGISSYNAASNVIQNCAFVNMPTNQGESSAIAQLIRATSNETVRIEVPSAYPNLSWAGYYKNDCFGEDQDSDNDGLSNNDEVFVYDTDPWLADSDSDGILDGEEIVDATNPKDIGSFMTNIEITLTNKVYYVGVTNYVFIGNVEKWDENLLFANSIISCKTNICTEVKAKELSVGVFSDLNRNGRYDVFEDVYVTKCDTSFLAVKHYDYVLGDIDSDGVDDACEMADGSDPYASNSFRISKRVTIKNENNVSGVTNYVYVSQSQDNFEASLCRAFVSGNVTLILNEVVSNRYLYVSCYRDFNRNGTYDESDVAYVWSITKSSDFIEERIIKDCDADGIVDNDEILEGTNPNNRSSYCYGVNATVVGVFSTTNVLKCLAAFGTNIIGMVGISPVFLP